MKKKNLNTSTWLTWSTCSIALLPAAPNAINSICIIAWAPLAVFSYFIKPKSTRRPGLFLLFSGNFLLLALSLFYSIDLKEGTTFLTTALPMLIFPLGFFAIGDLFDEIDKATILNKVLTVFWASTVLMALFVYYHFARLGYFAQIDKADSFNTILRETAGKVTDKHPDYLSVFLVFSLYIAAQRMLTGSSLTRRVIYGISIPLQGFLLLLLAARSPIFALVIGSIVICFWQIKRPLIRWTALAVLAISFISLIRFTPAIWSRIEEMKNTPLAVPVGVYHNSTNIRVGIYRCSWELISHHPWIGVGAGSDRKLLTECYAQFPTDVYQLTFYNTHNQYVNFWLLSGIFSLLLFLVSLLWQYRLSIRRRDYTLLFFLILMTIAFATENILSRQAGVVFYYFFVCLLVFCAGHSPTPAHVTPSTSAPHPQTQRTPPENAP